MDRYQPKTLYIGHGTKASITLQSQASNHKTIAQTWGKNSKSSRSHGVLRIQHSAIQKDNEPGNRDQRVLYVPLCHPQEEWNESLNESDTSQPVHYLYEIQDDYPKAAQGGHLPVSWVVSLGIKSACCHIPIARMHHFFSDLSGKHYMPVQDSSLWVINSPRDLHKSYDTRLTQVLKNGNSSLPLSRWCPNPGRILHASHDRWTKSNLNAAKVGLCTEPWQVPVWANTSVHSPMSPTWHQGDDYLITQREGSNNKGSGSQGSIIVHIQNFMRRLGLTSYDIMPLLLARFHSCPLHFWLKQTYKAPADLFKPLRFNQKAWEDLFW